MKIIWDIESSKVLDELKNQIIQQADDRLRNTNKVIKNEENDDQYPERELPRHQAKTERPETEGHDEQEPEPSNQLNQYQTILH